MGITKLRTGEINESDKLRNNEVEDGVMGIGFADELTVAHSSNSS